MRAWLGTWSYEADFASGTLTITRHPGEPDALDFALTALNGAHTGELAGRAELRMNTARYSAQSAEEGPCELVFRLTADSTLTIEQPEGTCGAGGGVGFDGRYRPGRKPTKARETTLHRLGVFRTEAEDAAFRRLVGADYHRFTESAQLVSEDTTSEFPGAVVYDSYVRGLGGLMANIIIIDPQQRIWAAVVAGDSVLYFTNQPGHATHLPATIRRWSGTAEHENRLIEYKSAPK